MGGFGSGGSRVGAGRKSKQQNVARLHGSRQRGTRPSAAVGPMEPVEMPEGMPSDQQAIWTELAPFALAARTLMPSTAAAFRDLCEAIVLKRMMLAEIMRDGLTQTKVTLQMDEQGGGLQSVEKKAHTLLAQHRGMMQRVEAGLARFRLSPNGKEIAVPLQPDDPFDEFDGDGDVQ